MRIVLLDLRISKIGHLSKSVWKLFYYVIINNKYIAVQANNTIWLNGKRQ